MTITRLAPALANGLNGYIAPACAAAVREARVQWNWQRYQRALKAAIRSHEA